MKPCWYQIIITQAAYLSNDLEGILRHEKVFAAFSFQAEISPFAIKSTDHLELIRTFMLNLANPGTEVDEPGNDDGIRNVAKEPTNNWYNKEGQFGISVLVADSLHGRHGYRHSPCT